MPATSLRSVLLATALAASASIGLAEGVHEPETQPTTMVAAGSTGGQSLAGAATTTAPTTARPTTPTAPTTASTTTLVPPATAAPTTAPTTTAPPTTAPPTTAAPTTAPPTTAAPAPPPTTAPPTTAAPAPPPASSSSCQGQFVSWVNQARADHGVAALASDGGITWIPADWARSMAERQSLAHNPNYAERIYRERPQATSVSENVGYSSEGARSVFDSFMASSGHRNNILDPSKTHAAAGCTVDGNGTTWVALDFWG